MINHQTINESIRTREPYTGFDEGTYYHLSLFKEFCNTRDYKRTAIFGYYKPKYGWTDAQAEDMYARAPDGWTDGVGVYRLYDWGKGENKIEKGSDWEWHDPQLDHIVPRSKGGEDIPGNFQVVPAIVNRVMTDLTDETAAAILPVLAVQFNCTTPPVTVEAVINLVGEIEAEDPIDWAMLNVNEEEATKLIALNVLDMYNNEWKKLSHKDYDYMVLSTITKLILENFVLNLKLLGKTQ